MNVLGLEYCPFLNLRVALAHIVQVSLDPHVVVTRDGSDVLQEVTWTHPASHLDAMLLV